MNGIRILTILAAVSISAIFAAAQGTPGTIRFPGDADTADSLFRTANNARTTLAAAQQPDATTIFLTNAASFPTSGAILIDSEIIYYAAKSGNVLTGIYHGQDGSTAVYHGAGAIVRGAIVAAHHRTLANAVIATQTKLGRFSSAPTTGEVLNSFGGGFTAWTNSPTVQRMLLLGSNAYAAPGASTYGAGSRLILFDGSPGDAPNGESMAIGVQTLQYSYPTGFWFNNLAGGEYRFYFGGNPAAAVAMTNSGIKSNGFVQLQNAGGRPGCDAARRGTLWQQFAASGTKDTVDVCVKAANDSYVWASLY